MKKIFSLFLAFLLAINSVAGAAELVGINNAAGVAKAALDSSTFYAPLTNSLLLTRGTGGPTYTRATTATETDWEGLLKTAISGEPRFVGARRVQNLLTYPEVFTNPNWATLNVSSVTDNYALAPDGTMTAARVVTNAGVAYIVHNNVTGLSNPHTATDSIWIKSNTGVNQTVQFTDNVVGGPLFTATPQWQRVGWSSTAAATTHSLGIQNSGGVAFDVLVWHPQCEDVTGQSNQNPSEYVSNGVLSAPYHGAGVDGVQYFPYQNGNTVSSNTVIEARGPPIPAATLKGYLSEGAATNLLLYSQDLSNAAWTKTNSSIGASIVAPDGTTTWQKIVENNLNGIHGVYQVFTGTAAVYDGSVFLKAGERTWAFIVLWNGTTQVGTAYINLATGALGTVTGTAPVVTALAGGGYRVSQSATLAASASCDIEVYLATGNGGASYLGDGVSGIYAWGAQLEQSAFATSYIPTTTVAVTRNEDNLSYPVSGNMSHLVGTIYAEMQTAMASANTPAALATWVYNDGVGNSGMMLREYPGNHIDFFSGGSGIVTDTTTTNTFTSGAAIKLAASYSGVVAKSVLNGGTVASGVFTPAAANAATLYIGRNSSAGSSSNGTTKNIHMWPTALPDYVDQAMTYQ